MGDNGEHDHPPAMIAHNCYGGGSVMVWGGITMTGRTHLHNCQENVTGLYLRDNVIEPIVMSFARRHGSAFILQNVKSRALRACVVQDRQQLRRIMTLPWPARSPDPSPTDRLRDILGRRVRRRPHKPQELAHINEFADELQEEWRRTLQATVGRLIRSTRRRCLACLAANGGHTRY